MKRGLILSIISIVFLLWIEQSLEVAYIWKTVAKAIFFLIVPVILFWKSGFPFLRFRNTDQKSIKIATSSGIAIMGIIVAVFVVLQPFIDIDALIMDLSAAGVTTITFPFIALYILFGNSILEEFFFRGLLPNLIGKSPFRVVLPSFLFAIYHISIFLPWFSHALLALAVSGLWIGGVIFQFANEKSGTILPSWIIHMFADIGVLIIGIYIIYFY